jgi:hypothetical protein
MSALTLDEVVAMNQDSCGLDGETHLIPWGIPSGYNFRDCGVHYNQNMPPPPNFTQATVYIHAGPREDKPNPPRKTFETKANRLWFRSAGSKKWAEGQVAKQVFAGMFETAETFSASAPGFSISGTDPGIATSPDHGVISHWWPRDRGIWSGGAIDGLFGVCSVRVTDPALSGVLIAQCGVDFWTPDHHNTADGICDWRMITSEWQDFAYFHYTGFTPEGGKAWLESSLPPYEFADAVAPIPPVEDTSHTIELRIDGEVVYSQQVT